MINLTPISNKSLLVCHQCAFYIGRNLFHWRDTSLKTVLPSCYDHRPSPSSWFSKQELIFKQKKYFSQAQEDVNVAQVPLTKVLKIAIIGTPNSGKSTFINQIVGRKVCAISSKVHTTRVRARAVITLEDIQVVFLDTPGLVSQAETEKYQLDKHFTHDGEIAMTEANVVAVIHDVANHYTRGRLDPKVLRLLHLYPHKHSVLILNKVDAVKKKHYLLELADRLTYKSMRNEQKKQIGIKERLSEVEVLKIIKMETGWPKFHQVFMVSALEGLGVGDVMAYLLQYAKPGKWQYDEEAFTDQPPEKIICDTVKGRMLEHLPQEVPYTSTVKLELLNKLSDGTMMAVVLITYPNARLFTMIKRKIRVIAEETEAELRRAFFTQVLVKLVLQPADK